MKWEPAYYINIKIETKDGKEYLHTIENPGTYYYEIFRDDEEESYFEKSVIAILNPYILCLSSDIDDLITKLKDGFVYGSERRGSEYYNYKKAVRYFDDNHEFIKKISEIDSMESIKSIEISGFASEDDPYYDLIGEITHKFDIENVTYEITDTSDYDGVPTRMFLTFHWLYSERITRNSFFSGVYDECPHGYSQRYIYNNEDKCIICSRCGANIDKDKCIINRKTHGIYCDEHCAPGSKYSSIRSVFGRQKNIEHTIELLKTRDFDRIDAIELLEVGTPLTFKYDKTTEEIEVFTHLGSIGVINKWDNPSKDMVSTLTSFENDENIKYEIYVSKVIPLSQRPKRGMKPIVEITIKADILIN